MPANPKYLSTPGQRVLKITAGILGGYAVSATFHLMMAGFSPIHEYAILLASFSFFLMWGVLIMTTFLARNGWKIWGIYLLLTLLFSLVTYVLTFHG